MSELATIETSPVVEFTDAQIETLSRTVARDVKSDTELDLFLAQCRRTGLDPFTRQIYFMRTGGRPTIVVSIDGFRLIASRSGRYAGQTPPEWCGPDGQWRDVWLESSPPAASRVGVYLDGVPHPIWGVVTWNEFGKGKGSTWNAMPSHMLAKVAESHALRKAFPNEMSGLYTADEMQAAGASSQPAPKLTSTETANVILATCEQMPEANCMKLAGWVTDSTGVPFTVEGLTSLPVENGEKILEQARKAATTPAATVVDDDGKADVTDLRADVKAALDALAEDRFAAFEDWLQAEGLKSFNARTNPSHLQRMWAWLQADTGAEPFDLQEVDA